MLEVLTSSVEETLAFGERLGACLRAGDFVSLEGPLGAGKSRLAEGIARGLGVPPEERIPSPTFTIVNEHQGRERMVHADLYRVGSAEELMEIGWRDYLAGEAVVVVEWLSLVGDEVAPAERVEVSIAIEGGQRRIRVVGRGARATEIVAALGA